MSTTFDPALLDFLESRVTPRWEGSVWREVLGETNPLRPNLRGARWNPPGVEALYCSLLAETAAAEIDYLISLQPVPVRKRRSIGMKVELTRVADLKDLGPLSAFGIERSDLLGATHNASRRIGRAVAWLGCAGLLVPSVRHPGVNLVVFTNEMAPGDSVEPV